MNKRLFVVDDFYTNPDEVRQFALTQVEYEGSSPFYKGKRSTSQYIVDGLQQSFEHIMNMKLKPLSTHGMCGRFQILTAEDPIVYHSDSQKWAGVIYLTPNAPHDSGTLLLKSRTTNARNPNDIGYSESFQNGFYDKTQFDIVDCIGNVYNRLVIFDAQMIHAATNYFGNRDDNSRLTHLFFFDNE